VTPPFLSRISLLALLAGASNAVAKELSYVKQLPETTRDADQNAETRRKLNEYARFKARMGEVDITSILVIS
jgi:hypothetical protein